MNQFFKNIFIYCLLLSYSGLIQAQALPNQTALKKVTTRQEALHEISEKEVLLQGLQKELDQMEREETPQGVYYGPIHWARWITGLGTVVYGAASVFFFLDPLRVYYGIDRNLLVTSPSHGAAKFYAATSATLGVLYLIARHFDKPSLNTKTSITEEHRNELQRQIKMLNEQLFILRTIATELPELQEIEPNQR